jgi:hypothetical protein
MGTTELGALECEYEDAIDEIVDYPILDKKNQKNGFIALEDEKHRVISLLHIGKNNWGIIFSTAEKSGFSDDEMKSIVQDYYNGKIPDWVQGQVKNDFPDGIDDILEGSF